MQPQIKPDVDWVSTYPDFESAWSRLVDRLQSDLALFQNRYPNALPPIRSTTNQSFISFSRDSHLYGVLAQVVLTTRPNERVIEVRWGSNDRPTTMEYSPALNLAGEPVFRPVAPENKEGELYQWQLARLVLEPMLFTVRGAENGEVRE